LAGEARSKAREDLELSTRLSARFNPTALIGVAGGYTDSDLSVDAMHTDGTVQGSRVGIYGVKTFVRIYLA